jgi:glycine cleavage system H protein
VVKINDYEFPDHLRYDIDNQIWYDSLEDGTVRAGFTQWAVSLMGEVLVFTPKRIGRDFERGRSFATVEGGKWIGSARAAFDGVVVSHNENLIRKPELLMADSYGEGWMLVVRPSDENWRASLVTGSAIAPAFQAWLTTDSYKRRAE